MSAEGTEDQSQAVGKVEDLTHQSPTSGVPVDYECRVGVMGIGGCGENNLRIFMNKHSPKEYPGVHLFIGNTDAKVLKLHFGDPEEPHQKAWQEAGCLTVYQFGEDEVTQGRGAGADPRVGRKAAETPASIKAMTEFFNKVDEVILVAGLGGGTGTGATLVAAKLAKKLGKNVVVEVVMPHPDDGRTERATRALRELEAYVLTFPFANSYLPVWLKLTMSEIERAKVTYERGWEIVNEYSVIRILRIMREILQVTGDMLQIDQADWDASCKHGHYGMFGLHEVKEPDKVHEVPAEEIVNELCAAHFQNPAVISKGNVIVLWAHGPWPMEKYEEVRKIIRDRVLAGDPTGEKKVEVHRGNIAKVSDRKMWMALIIVAKEKGEKEINLPGERESGEVQEALVVSSPAPKANGTRPVVSTLPSVTVENYAGKSEIRFVCDGKWVTEYVEDDLCGRFLSAYNHTQRTTEMEGIFEEVFAATGKRPDMLSRFKASGDKRSMAFSDKE